MVIPRGCSRRSRVRPRRSIGTIPMLLRRMRRRSDRGNSNALRARRDGGAAYSITRRGHGRADVPRGERTRRQDARGAASPHAAQLSVSRSCGVRAGAAGSKDACSCFRKKVPSVTKLKRRDASSAQKSHARQGLGYPLLGLASFALCVFRFARQSQSTVSVGVFSYDIAAKPELQTPKYTHEFEYTYGPLQLRRIQFGAGSRGWTGL